MNMLKKKLLCSKHWKILLVRNPACSPVTLPIRIHTEQRQMGVCSASRAGNITQEWQSHSNEASVHRLNSTTKCIFYFRHVSENKYINKIIKTKPYLLQQFRQKEFDLPLSAKGTHATFTCLGKKEGNPLQF